jgi:hypothetical protein
MEIFFTNSSWPETDFIPRPLQTGFSRGGYKPSSIWRGLLALGANAFRALTELAGFETLSYELLQKFTNSPWNSGVLKGDATKNRNFHGKRGARGREKDMVAAKSQHTRLQPRLWPLVRTFGRLAAAESE